MAVTKTLQAARPTIDPDTGKVRSWYVEVLFKEDGFEEDFELTVDVSDRDKAPGDYTQSELIGLLPPGDAVFQHHKAIAQGTVSPSPEHVTDFDWSSLPKK